METTTKMNIDNSKNYTTELTDATVDLKNMINENSRIICAHSSKFAEISKNMEGCEKIITDMLEYINGDLYDWVIKTEERQNDSDASAILMEQRLKDIEQNQKESAKLLNTLCVNMYTQLKDIASFISVLYIICGSLSIGSFIALMNMGTGTPEYAVAFAMLLVCTIALVCISTIIKKIAYSNRFVYRSLYAILGEDTSDEEKIEESGN